MIYFSMNPTEELSDVKLPSEVVFPSVPRLFCAYVQMERTLQIYLQRSFAHPLDENSMDSIDVSDG